MSCEVAVSSLDEWISFPDELASRKVAASQY